MMKFWILLGLVVLCVSERDSNVTNDLFLGEDWESGIVDLGNGGDDMWYWLFRPRNGNLSAPLMLWLNGGPGCSDSDAIFYELGPFNITVDYELVRNEFSWNTYFHILFVDQPVGVGWSQNKDNSTYCRNQTCVDKNMNYFLVKFFFDHPEYNGRPFYISGESYGGHYVPSIGAFIHRQQHENINLKGVAIGNGMVNPEVQYGAYAEFAYNYNKLNFVDYIFNRAALATCQLMIKMGLGTTAFNFCEHVNAGIMGDPPRFNEYDITMDHDYDWARIGNFWKKRQDVRKALGVDGREFSGGSWLDCSPYVYPYFAEDFVTSYADDVLYLVENGVNVMMYQGNHDYICNCIGDEAWVRKMKWSGRNEFNKQAFKNWDYKGKTYANYKHLNNVAFVTVLNAGHMVPMDQPEFSLEMINKFVAWEFPDSEN